MTRINTVLKKIVISLLLVCALSIPAYAKIVDKIVAIVNDEVITQSELERVLYPLYIQYARMYEDEKELYRRLDESRVDILKQMISDKLILSEAKRLKLEIAENEIDAHLETVKSELSGKGLNLENLLEEQNLTLHDLHKRYRDQLMIQKAIDTEVVSRVSIQPSKVSNYYFEHIGDYTQPQQVAAYSILVKLESERAPLESRQLAQDVHKMLLDGYDFGSLARNYSDDTHKKEGGDLGYLNKGQMLKEIDDVIFSLDVGEISDVIETPIGYHVFKVYDKKEKKVIGLDKVRSKVIEALYRAEIEERFGVWVENLKSNAYISIR